MHEKLNELIALAKKALADGDTETATKYTEEAQALRVQIDLEALEVAEAERKTAETKAAEEKAEAEVKARIEAAVAEAVKDAGIVRPDYTGDGDGTPSVPERFRLRAATAPYDRLGTLDLATRYYLKSCAAKRGVAAPPSERMLNALTMRAAQFVQEKDEIPYLDRYGEVKVKSLDGLDYISAVVPWGKKGQETVVVPGFGNVNHGDNVTPGGIKSLMDIAVKANEVVYSTQASYGDDWVPTLMAAALWRTIRLEARVLPLFDQFDMPSNPYDYPRESTDPTIYGVGETTAEAQLVIGSSMPIPDSKIGTANVTFSAGKIGGITFWSEEMNEDSIIAVESQYRDQYGVVMAHGIDALLLNGDETTGTSNISDYGGTIATTSSYLKVDGLRHEAIVTTTADSRDGGALTIEDINTTRALMGTAGAYGADPTQLVILSDVPTAFKFGDLGEVLTRDKFGELATILHGQVTRIKGVPIVMSQDYGLTDASGYIHNTPGNNTKGSFMVVNRQMVKVGWRRRPRIIVGQVPFSDAWYILILARLDLGFFGAGAVGMSHNITV